MSYPYDHNRKYTILKLKVNDRSYQSIRSAKVRSSDFETINSTANIRSKRLIGILRRSYTSSNTLWQSYISSKWSYSCIQDRIVWAIHSGDRIFQVNDCIRSVKIVSFQPGSYSFCYDRSFEILDLNRIVIFNFHDRVIYHSIKLPASIDRISDRLQTDWSWRFDKL